MANIKTNISFDEYTAIVNKVVNDCFPDGVYSPANYELSFRIGLLCAFAPDFDLSDCDDNNALWERVMSDEAENIVNEIFNAKNNSIYLSLETAIDNAIKVRNDMITSGGMSMSDYALSKLFDVLTEKIDKIDTSVFNKDNIETVAEAVNKSKDGNFEENIVDALLDKGLLAKPNRETRRKNGQRTKKTDKPNITVNSKEDEK